MLVVCKPSSLHSRVIRPSSLLNCRLCADVAAAVRVSPVCLCAVGVARTCVWSEDPDCCCCLQVVEPHLTVTRTAG